MKYLLIPLSFVAWYFISYFGLYIGMLSMGYVFSLSWLWIIIAYLPIIAVVGGLSVGIPGLLRYKILEFYGFNRSVGIIHTFAGLIGVAWFFIFHSMNPPEVVIGDERMFMLSGMWELSPLKFIVLAFPYLAFVVGIVWSCIFAPLFISDSTSA